MAATGVDRKSETDDESLSLLVSRGMDEKVSSIFTIAEAGRRDCGRRVSGLGHEEMTDKRRERAGIAVNWVALAGED